MNIVVCLKQVPDAFEVKIDSKTGTLIRDGLPSIINPEDKNALEAALVLKDNNGAHVTVISMGPPQAEKALREALSMGADEAILISDITFAGADTLATSNALAGAMGKLDYDIIFAGRQSIDGNTAQVGPELAEHLGIAQVTYVKEVMSIDRDTLKIKKALEDGYEVLTVKTPVLLTAIKELNTPRYINMSYVFETFKKEIKVWTAGDIGVDKSLLGLSGSGTKVFKSWAKKVEGKGGIVDLPFKEAVAYTVSKLKEKHII
ncbi:electron transfer flavoprotein subunit beta [Clostridium sp.]